MLPSVDVNAVAIDGRQVNVAVAFPQGTGTARVFRVSGGAVTDLGIRTNDQTFVEGPLAAGSYEYRVQAESSSHRAMMRTAGTVAVGGRALSTPLATRTLGVQPDVGALLLSGTDPEPWLVAIQPRPTTAGDFVPAGCFSVPGRARSDGRTLFLHVDDARGAIELAVPVAAAWVEPKHRDASDELTGTVTCLNDRGQATVRY